MKKIFALLLAFVLAFAPAVFAASVDVSDDSTHQGRARELNFGSGIAATVSGGVASISAAVAAITSGTISGVTITSSAISGTVVAATQYLRMAVSQASLRQGSNASAGSLIGISNATGAQDCGTAGGGTTFVVCVSDGTDWKAV